MSHCAQSNQNDTTREDVITDNVHPGTSVALDVVAPTAAAPPLPTHSEPVKPFDTLILRVSTSAPVGDPDPYLRVYSLTIFKLRSVQVVEDG